MATTEHDYYEILGVPRDADNKTIKNAFRKLAMKFHPDRNKVPDAEARFKEIAKAYGILSDPKKRADYDSHGHAGVADFSVDDLYGGINFDDIFGGLGFDFGVAGSPFEHFFHSRRRAPARGANIERTLEIPLEKVVTGGEHLFTYNRQTKCPTCGGTGAKPGTQPKKCTECSGSGRKTVRKNQNGLTIQQVTLCRGCSGKGTIIEKPCKVCNGQTTINEEEKLNLKIPVGVHEGMALRIPGYGSADLENGGPPGDLYVVIQSQPDPRFERHGIDLWRNQALHVADAVLGTTVESPTLDSATVKVEVPSGSQPDTVLEIKNQGLPEFGNKVRGNLYVRLKVEIPDHLSEDEHALYKKLQQLAHAPSSRVPKTSSN